MKHRLENACPHENIGAVCVHCGLSRMDQRRQRLVRILIRRTPVVCRALVVRSWAEMQAQALAERGRK